MAFFLTNNGVITLYGSNAPSLKTIISSQILSRLHDMKLTKVSFEPNGCCTTFSPWSVREINIYEQNQSSVLLHHNAWTVLSKIKLKIIKQDHFSIANFHPCFDESRHNTGSHIVCRLCKFGSFENRAHYWSRTKNEKQGLRTITSVTKKRERSYNNGSPVYIVLARTDSFASVDSIVRDSMTPEVKDNCFEWFTMSLYANALMVVHESTRISTKSWPNWWRFNAKASWLEKIVLKCKSIYKKFDAICICGWRSPRLDDTRDRKYLCQVIYYAFICKRLHGSP